MTTSPPEAPTNAPGDPGPSDPAGSAAAPGPSDPQGPRVTRDEIRDLRTLRRTVGPHRYLAGVSGGVARHLDIDPVVVRVLFVVLTFFGGVGLLLYAAFWLVLPADGAAKAIFNLDQRSLTFAIVGVLGFSAFLLIGGSWGGFGFPWPLTVLGIVVAAVLLSRDRRREGSQAPVGYGYSSPTTPPPGLPWPAPPRPVKPLKPKKKGPILFWFTLALIALALGTLGVVDVAGVSVAGSAYAALALGVTGLMLLVGAFYGRAGGLIVLGLLLVPTLAVSTAFEDFVSTEVTYAPTRAAQVQDAYSMGGGQLVLDLRGVQDPERLDGKTISLDGDLGLISVILPPRLDTTVTAKIGGFGDIWALGRSAAGIEPRLSFTNDVVDPDASIDLDVTLGVGEVDVATNERFHP